MKNKTFWIALLIVIILGAISLYSPQTTQVDKPITTLQQDIYTTTLNNGLQVTVKEIHALPLVTIQFWVKTGAKNEPEAFKGIAHIFEHMWFKGTATQPVGSFDKRVESLGGELNAMTYLDWTMYYVVLPSDKFDDIFPYMADLLLNPLFDETEIEKEKEVVLEEQRFDFNEPERYLDTEFTKLLIKKHPYRNPTIGYKDTITAPTRENIVEFYKTWYSPNNMNIVIVGNVNKHEITTKVDNAFKNFNPVQLPTLQRPKEPPITTPRYESTFRDIAYNYVEIGFHAPKSSDEDRWAMEVLNTIWTGGDSSRLQGTVKKEKNLVVRASSIYIPLNELGFLGTTAVIQPETVGTAKAELIYQLGRFATEQVTDEELQRAKALIKSSLVQSQEEIFQVGFDIGLAWIDGDINYYTNYLNNINKVTKQDVQNVAKKYLSAYTMYELKPTI